MASGATAGLGNKFGVAAQFKAGHDFIGFAREIAVAASVQVAEMGVDPRRKFDWKAVLEDGIGKVGQAEMANVLPGKAWASTRQVLDEAAGAAGKALAGSKVDPAMVAVGMISDRVGDETADVINHHQIAPQSADRAIASATETLEGTRSFLSETHAPHVDYQHYSAQSPQDRAAELTAGFYEQGARGEADTRFATMAALMASQHQQHTALTHAMLAQIGRASCRERV